MRSAAFAMLIAFAAACSGDSAVGPETTLDAAEPTIPATATDEDEPAPLDQGELRPISPIDAFLGLLDDPVAMSEAYSEANQRYADQMTTCMRTAGYDFYTEDLEPSPPPEAFIGGRRGGSTDAIERLGTGIGWNAMNALNLIDHGSDEYIPSANAIAQTEGYDALSPEGQAIFEDNYYACLDQADEDFEIPGTVRSEEVALEVDAFRSELIKHPNAIRIWDEWSSCMAGEGYNVETRSDAYRHLETRGQELFRNLASGREPDADDEAEAQAIADEEAVIVESDVRCARSVDLDDRLFEVEFAAESEWIAENGDRLALVLAEENAASGGS